VALNVEDSPQFARHLETLRTEFGDDPFQMNDYYGYSSNIARWRGQFMKSIDLLKKALAESRKTGDNNLVWQRLNNLKVYLKWLWEGQKPSQESVEVAVQEMSRSSI